MLRRQLAASVRTILITGDTSSVVRELRHDERPGITSKLIKAEELLSIIRGLLVA